MIVFTFFIIVYNYWILKLYSSLYQWHINASVVELSDSKIKNNLQFAIWTINPLVCMYEYNIVDKSIHNIHITYNTYIIYTNINICMHSIYRYKYIHI